MTSIMYYKDHALWLDKKEFDGCDIPIADFTLNTKIDLPAMPKSNVIGPRLSGLWNDQFNKKRGDLYDTGYQAGYLAGRRHKGN